MSDSMPPPRQKFLRAKRAALRRGQRGEWLAMLWLRGKGYRIVARRVRRADGEIDVIAQRARLVIFVEVKARPSLAEAAAALTPWQWQRVQRAARVWLAAHPQAAAGSWRYDAVLLAPWHWPRHLEGAWEDAP